MPIPIGRDRLQELVRTDLAQVVEALPRQEYEDVHIAGAISLPLEHMSLARATETLDPRRPIVTYCFDMQCDLSPRAAWRLESLGYGPVYDYEGGKADWLAFGLPTEGVTAEVRIGGISERDTPTCGLRDRAGSVLGNLPEGHSQVVAVNEERIVLGVVRRSHLHRHQDATVEDLIDPGPSTYRPSVPAHELLERMQDRGFENALVTDSDGRLWGEVSRRALESALATTAATAR